MVGKKLPDESPGVFFIAGLHLIAGFPEPDFTEVNCVLPLPPALFPVRLQSQNCQLTHNLGGRRLTLILVFR